jgi:hypothetical protein
VLRKLFDIRYLQIVDQAVPKGNAQNRREKEDDGGKFYNP